MKRSEINNAVSKALLFFNENGWALPPNPQWDVTDFGLGDFSKYGLVLINLAEQPEYCEKLMYATKGQITPAHAHKKKKEDIIVRKGQLTIQVWMGNPEKIFNDGVFELQINNEKKIVNHAEVIKLSAGERVTLTPGIYHEFYPVSESCIIGEVSTANDDAHDNFFVNKEVGRFSEIEEDEPPLVKLINEQ
ncbi:MAG: D-lyxose/D-mannose family sugar isomerase [Candidatus Cyclobacteriaceae bacterium M3_2C_046]